MTDGDDCVFIYPATSEERLEDAMTTDLVSSQNGDNISSLDAACSMVGYFSYSDGEDITVQFKHTMSVMTFSFESESAPSTLLFTNGEDRYEVNYESITSEDGFYTSYIMIKPYEQSQRELTFSLYNSDGDIYDYRSVTTTKPFVAGMRYTSPLSDLSPVEWVGDGSQTAPYIISSGDGLRLLSNRVAAGSDYSGIYFEMSSDIDLNGIDSDGNGIAAAEFVPIGNKTTNFKGTFNGNGYVVKGLYINQSDTDYQALFGSIKDAKILNLSVEGSVVGNDWIAGIVAYVSGDSYIVNCINKAIVKGRDNVGGIIGSGGGYVPQIANCYNLAKIEGNENVGGLAGYGSYTSFQACYSVGEVIGNSNVGALFGCGSVLVVEYCYYAEDIVAQGIGKDRGGTTTILTPMNSNDMKKKEFVSLLNKAAFLYGCPSNIEVKASLWLPVDNNYPVFDITTPAKYDIYSAGDGTEESPYEISNAEELRNLSIMSATGEDYTGVYFKLTEDIDLGGIDDDGGYVETNSFTPIGKPGYYPNNYYFKGIFDGMGHTVSGLYINSDNSQIALFGAIDNATIKNLVVSGRVVCGYNSGGVVGQAGSSTIINCANMVEVSAVGVNDNLIGGIVGSAQNGTSVVNCYNIANIDSGASYVGGLVGSASSSTFTNLYNISSVAYGENKGCAIVGSSYSSTFDNCFWANDIENAPLSGMPGETDNSIAKAKADMQTQEFVDLLNQGVADYNSLNLVNQACTWILGTDGYPVLNY